jgi:hypothetical protein
MPPTDDLTPNSIQVREQNSFGPTGAAAHQKIVTYFVGAHGPFTLTYDAATFNVDQLKTDIRKEVANLQSLSELTG